MSELNTVTLTELPVADSVGQNDHILIESGGRMKRASGNLVGSGDGYVLDIREYQSSGGGVA